MTDFLDEKRREITDRLKELAPMVEEYRRLEAAASALDGIGSSAAAAVAPRRRGPGRPRGSGKAAAAPRPRKKPGRPKKVGRPASSGAAATGAPRRRAGRRKGSGTRAAQALAFVQGQPGITIPELAAKMGIKQNYLYRVLPGLEQEGKIGKQGRGWHPKS
ncbi:MAG TPA: hypothetical protein VES65_10265 [Solirubrobacteraceae bacterium]|nr:hypothetical protein [Solirubrobacteraceae bacterium]